MAAAFALFWAFAEVGRAGGGHDALSTVFAWSGISLIALSIGFSGVVPWVAAGSQLALLLILISPLQTLASVPMAMGLLYIAIRLGLMGSTLARSSILVLLTANGAAIGLRNGLLTEGLLVALALLGAWGGARLWRVQRIRRDLLAQRIKLTLDLDVAGRELAALSERGRVARDVHDIMAQSLSIILAQADGARALSSTDPTRALSAFNVIADVSRSSLVELRMLLESLSSDPEPQSQPNLAALPELYERFVRAGLVVTASEEGKGFPLTATQEQAVYRITQEALTNALRHSGPPPNAAVHFVWDSHTLLYEVSSAGSPDHGSNHGSGHGLIGMRERAILVGGWLTAENAPDGKSFTVTASFPRTKSQGQEFGDPLS
ncbi:hypothetical protein ITJ38_17680 [Agreia pratensis]|uniref:sensor histidine kinase n=1 Tax=Agreia pratensis TaxID=150121 RepID=UPI001889F63D|nr:histidine kinase [Agreia pratensis]MBF4636245.1 hypothetical protein [Agreia pratensis]